MNAKEIYPVEKRETEEGAFWFFRLGERNQIVWVSSRLIKPAEGYHYIEFPCQGAALETTARGNMVLRPREGFTTLIVGRNCGYRGSSSFKLLSPVVATLEFEIYHSPRGSLGVSSHTLVTARDEDLPVRFSWRRTGRLYGDPNCGISTIDAEGNRIDLDGISEPEDIAELAEALE